LSEQTFYALKTDNTRLPSWQHETVEEQLQVALWCLSAPAIREELRLLPHW
jgi:hypothetical protein